VVKRGPNAGSRFVLDQPITSAGRHPNSDIFCDDIPSVAGTPTRLRTF
jgi:pSer/pThr/pTyr-binding forkhead associated (FHA) protein